MFATRPNMTITRLICIETGAALHGTSASRRAVFNVASSQQVAMSILGWYASYDRQCSEAARLLHRTVNLALQSVHLVILGLVPRI
jgi:hypothetical protein